MEIVFIKNKCRSRRKDISFLGLKRSVPAEERKKRNLFFQNFFGFISESLPVLFLFFFFFFSRVFSFLVRCFGLQEDDILREQIRLHGTEK